MEDIKTQINYMLEKVKRDIKNTEPSLENLYQKLSFVNDKLDIIYLIALISNKPKICNNIIKYYEEQGKLEDQVIALQNSMLKNKDNILEHLMREL